MLNIALLLAILCAAATAGGNDGAAGQFNNHHVLSQIVGLPRKTSGVCCTSFLINIARALKDVLGLVTEDVDHCH